jgi:hypothetical protein
LEIIIVVGIPIMRLDNAAKIPGNTDRQNILAFDVVVVAFWMHNNKLNAATWTVGENKYPR